MFFTKKTALTLLTVLLVAAANLANASSQTGVITRLLVRDNDGLIWVVVDGNRTQQPLCASNSYWMIKNENSEVGKRQHATLLAAMMAGRKVKLHGTGACSRWGDGEDINTVEVLAN